MEMFQQLFAIFVVLGVLCGGVWLLKRKGFAYSRARRPNGAGHPRLEVLDRLALSPNHSLHLVRMADRTLLIGLSPNGCNLLESGQNTASAFSQVATQMGREL
jgi:flagellar biosynthetic protein FliO